MDLEYGPQYDAFRKEVIKFIKENEDVKLEGPVRSKSRITWQQKLIDNTKLKEFGWCHRTPLDQGIQKTYNYFVNEIGK